MQFYIPVIPVNQTSVADNRTSRQAAKPSVYGKRPPYPTVDDALAAATKWDDIWLEEPRNAWTSSCYDKAKRLAKYYGVDAGEFARRAHQLATVAWDAAIDDPNADNE